MDLKFHDKIVFRTSRFPFPFKGYSRKDMEDVLQQKDFAEAIYFASPVLYDEIIKWNSGTIPEKKKMDKLLYSLHRYLSRMSSRCTPYGLFASCSTAKWGLAN